MSDTKTLDQKIRTRALETLKSEANQATRQFLRYLNDGLVSTPKVKLFDAEGKQVSLRDAVELIETAVVEAKAKPVQDRAVADFISKVDSFQGQLDELHQSIA